MSKSKQHYDPLVEAIKQLLSESICECDDCEDCDEDDELVEACLSGDFTCEECPLEDCPFDDCPIKDCADCPYDDCPYDEEIEEEVERDLRVLPPVHRVYFNDRHTTIEWEDGAKTTVGCAKEQHFDEYAGFCAAFLKRVFGSSRAAIAYMNERKVVQPAAPRKVKKGGGKHA